MALTQVSFETVKEILDECTRKLTHKPFDLVINRNTKFSWIGEPMSITFEQVTKIESMRRQIEGLQNSLGSRVHIRHFGWKAPNDNWIKVDDDAQAVLAEAYCKVTVAKIIKLLDESERLGVDVSTSKQTLLEFLEEIKPKEEVTP